MLCVDAVHAQGWDDAQRALSRRDFRGAVAALKDIAESGNAESQYRLGFLYRWGLNPSDPNDVYKSFRYASYWFQRAAEQNHGLAQCSLAMHYEDGKGVPKDYEKAFRYYSLGFANGAHYCSAIFLARMYRDGKGISESKVKAYTYYNLDQTENASHERVSLEKRMTREEISQAQRLTRDCIASNYKNCD